MESNVDASSEIANNYEPTCSNKIESSNATNKSPETLTTISTISYVTSDDGIILTNAICSSCNNILDNCHCNSNDDIMYAKKLELKNLLQSWNLEILYNYFISKFY